MKQIKNSANDKLITVIKIAFANMSLFCIAPLNRLAAGSSAVADSSIHNSGMITDLTRDTDLDIDHRSRIVVSDRWYFNGCYSRKAFVALDIDVDLDPSSCVQN